MQHACRAHHATLGLSMVTCDSVRTLGDNVLQRSMPATSSMHGAVTGLYRFVYGWPKVVRAVSTDMLGYAPAITQRCVIHLPAPADG